MGKNTTNRTEEAYLQGLKNRDNATLTRIYKDFFPALRQHVKAHGGSVQDAEDVFQEAMVVVYRKVRQPSFELTSQFQTFLIGVGKRIWLNRISRSSRNVQTDLEKTELADTTNLERELEQTEKYRLYRDKMTQLGEDCQKVLKLYMQGQAMSHIAQQMGYASEGYAKKRKFQCKQQLTKLIKSDPRFKEING